MSAEQNPSKQYVILERTYRSGQIKQVWSSEDSPTKFPRRHSLKTDRIYAVIERGDEILAKIPLDIASQLPKNNH